MAKDKKAAEASTSKLAPGPDGKGVAPKTNAPGTEPEAKKEKNLIPDIIRGRLPIAVVFIARFGDNKNMATKDMATLFGTTAGKIADIKGKSTFVYLPENFKPTLAQKDDAVAWFRRHVGFKEGKVDKLIDEVEGLEVATAEQAKEFEEVRAKAKGQTPKTKEGKEADGGGGNRIGKKEDKPAKISGKNLLK